MTKAILKASNRYLSGCSKSSSSSEVPGDGGLLVGVNTTCRDMGHTKAFHIEIRVMITGNHHNVHHPAATSYLVAELRSVHARIMQVQNCAVQSSPVQSPGFTVTRRKGLHKS